ncbi:MAG: type II toxin-antitoxin system VapB family antitoxin [Chloroflexi bacterium]|nr:type II toxin-antitoxin system VapB family antitoxin [Chloroflexota bacterium]
MALNIKSKEAHELAAKLAKLTGKSMTAVVTEALRTQLRQQHLPGKRNPRTRIDGYRQALCRSYSSTCNCCTTWSRFLMVGGCRDSVVLKETFQGKKRQSRESANGYLLIFSFVSLSLCIFVLKFLTTEIATWLHIQERH